MIFCNFFLCEEGESGGCGFTTSPSCTFPAALVLLVEGLPKVLSSGKRKIPYSFFFHEGSSGDTSRYLYNFEKRQMPWTLVKTLLIVEMNYNKEVVHEPGTETLLLGIITGGGGNNIFSDF